MNTDQSQNKVSAERCAALMGVAIANKMDEVWIAKPKVLRLLYLVYCFPIFAKWYRLFTKYVLSYILITNFVCLFFFFYVNRASEFFQVEFLHTIVKIELYT